MELGFFDQQWREAGGNPGDSDAPLRPLGWNELCARLAASQDFRELMTGDASALAARRVGSFHRPAARMLAAVPRGGHVVNLNSSANGKAAGATRGTADAAASSPVAIAPVEPSFFE